jgi:outer membrane immunogenic protein
MKRFVLRALALLATGGLTQAKAADFGGYAPPPPPPQQYAPGYTVAQPLDCYSWAGPYLGGNLGYTWGEVTNNPTKPSGVSTGIQFGYNFQPGNGPWVFGFESDLQVNGAEDTFAPWKFSNPWFGTVRGRGGYSFSNILLYATAGLAFGELRGETFGLSESHTSAGWTVGFGAEVGFAPRWSAKFEYLFVDLASNPFTITGVSNGYQANVVRAGVNYHF